MGDVKLYRVDVRHFCAGFVVEGGRIVLAAPILGWAVGKTVEDLTRWVKSKGGKVERI